MGLVKHELRQFYHKLENRIASGLLITCLLFFSLIAEGLPSPAMCDNNSEKEADRKSLIMLAGMQQNQLAGTPTITIESYMVPFQAETGQEDVQHYYVTGSGFIGGQVILLEINDPSGSFTISSMTSGYGTRVELVADYENKTVEELIAVRFVPAVAGAHTATITHSTEGAVTQTLLVEGNGTSLPVEWLSFTAQADKGDIILDWATASEKDNSHFEVEVSKDPIRGFKKIGRVESKVGNSKVATSYSFRHRLGDVNGTWYFRLKQVDFDNAFEYSKLIATELHGAGEVKVNVAPNPVTDNSTLNITVAEAGRMHIFILNPGGTEVYSKMLDLETGTHRIPLHFSYPLSTGIYILTTEFKGNINRQKLIK